MPQNPVRVPFIAVSATGVGVVTAVAGVAKTLAASDANKYLRFTNAAPVALTIPPNSGVALPIGFQITGVQAGAGAVTVTAGAGVTINSISSKVATAGQFAAFTAVKVGLNAWDLFGDLA